jgi:UDP-GlcNAc3NAcA epimerase
MKVVTVIGARPQFIKAAPISRAMAERGGMRNVMIHTGQHYDANMSDIFFSELEIPPPDYNLEIGGGRHGDMTGKQLAAVESVLIEEKPDALIVYGDTNSTLAGALAAAKLHIPVAHVEAGLRSFNKRMPEEINRIMTDHISTWLFAPTEQAVAHLANEGITGDLVHNVGDVMYDAALYYGAQADAKSDILDRLNLSKDGYDLSTVHRQENTDDPKRMGAILEVLASRADDGPVVLPLHPRTRKICAANEKMAALLQKITVIEPVGFFDIIALLRNANLVLTDSGGMQKEAFFHNKPVVILRDETEWSELIDLNWACLAPPSSMLDILGTISHFEANNTRLSGKPYGSGNAAPLIIEKILEKK